MSKRQKHKYLPLKNDDSGYSNRAEGTMRTGDNRNYNNHNVDYMKYTKHSYKKPLSQEYKHEYSHSAPSFETPGSDDDWSNWDGGNNQLLLPTPAAKQNGMFPFTFEEVMEYLDTAEGKKGTLLYKGTISAIGANTILSGWELYYIPRSDRAHTMAYHLVSLRSARKGLDYVSVGLNMFLAIFTYYKIQKFWPVLKQILTAALYIALPKIANSVIGYFFPKHLGYLMFGYRMFVAIYALVDMVTSFYVAKNNYCSNPHYNLLSYKTWLKIMEDCVDIFGLEYCKATALSYQSEITTLQIRIVQDKQAYYVYTQNKINKKFGAELGSKLFDCIKPDIYKNLNALQAPVLSEFLQLAQDTTKFLAVCTKMLISDQTDNIALIGDNNVHSEEL